MIAKPFYKNFDTNSQLIRNFTIFTRDFSIVQNVMVKNDLENQINILKNSLNVISKIVKNINETYKAEISEMSYKINYLIDKLN